MSDIEKGGTFTKGTNKSGLISKEINTKTIVDPSSSSEPEYMFSSARRSDMINEGINANTNAFSTSYNGAMAGPKNDQDYFMSAFKTDVQGDFNLRFGGNDNRHSLSVFGNRQKEESRSFSNRSINTRIKNIVSK